MKEESVNHVFEVIGYMVIGALLVVLFAFWKGYLHTPDQDSSRPEQQIQRAVVAPVPRYIEPRKPTSDTQSFAMMPSQTVNLPNRRFRKVEIHSTFPLRVLTGKCHEEYTVEFFCNDEPADIFIQDVRRVPIFRTPEGNTVTITGTEF